MGSRTISQTTIEDSRRARFAECFPRLFAYTHSLTDDEVRAREIVVESFSHTFADRSDLDDEECQVVRVGMARDLCRRVKPGLSQTPNGLGKREREVLALVFDAQLSRPLVASVMRCEEKDVVAALLRGLRKLQAQTAPVHVPYFFRSA